MKTYIKNGNIIKATEKAFRVIYEQKGYKLLDDTIKPLKSLTIEQLKSKAKELGIENYSKMKKDKLIEVLSNIEGA